MAPVIFEPVIGTVGEFINWSLTIVSIMIIWYVVKFFMVAPPTEEQKKKSKEAYEERGAKMREWFGNKMTERENKEKAAVTAKEKKEKKENVSPVVDDLLKALEAAKDMSQNLTKGERRVAVKKFKELDGLLDNARGILRRLARKHPDDKDALIGILEKLHAAQVTFSETVSKLPKKITEDNQEEWKKAVKEVVNAIEKSFNGSINLVIKEITKFHK